MTPRNLLLALALGGLAAACTPKKQTTSPEQAGPVACTKDAMVCPDGSAVGRTGANCEFAPCPEAAAPVDEAAPDAAAPPV